MTALLFAALFAAYLLRPTASSSAAGELAKFVCVVLLVAGGAVVMSQAQSFFALEDLSVSSVEAAFTTTSDQASGDDATFEAIDLRNPPTTPAPS